MSPELSTSPVSPLSVKNTRIGSPVLLGSLEPTVKVSVLPPDDGASNASPPTVSASSTFTSTPSVIVPVASSRVMPSAAVPFTVTPVAATVKASGPSKPPPVLVVSTIVPLAVVASVTVSVTVSGCGP